ncbi:MAG: sugar ABC transporter substrate-binding protein [Lachnospiraceae bacterium]|nr:sugar ABC transporter substrate-binding protein [Lachnospiraceae bacterium]
MKKIIAMLLALTMAVSVVACGSKSAEAPTSEEVAVTEDAEEKTEVDEEFKVGLCNINEKGAFGKLVKYGFEQACKERGWTLVYADNNSNGQQGVTNADTMVLQEVDFVCDLNVDASVGDTIKGIFDNAGIPVLAVDIALGDAPFFGIDSEQLGYFNGETAAKYIKENYAGEVDYVVLMTQIASGDEVQKRVRAAIDALDDNGIKYGEVVELEGENDAAISQTRFTDFLTAHPDAESIIVFTINENAAQGVYAGAVTADREWDCRIFSANCGTQFVEPMYESGGNQSWVCTISNFTELYGEQCCQLIEQYLETGSIPENTCCKFEAITWENINEYYPEGNCPWDYFE